MRLQINIQRKTNLGLKIILIVLLSVCLYTTPALAFVDRGEIKSMILPNGLEVFVQEEPAQKVAELQVWVGVGSRDEPVGKEGIAHLFEHMLFKGTKKRGVGEIARTVEGAGGDINAYTSMDHTVYHITIAAEFMETAMDILADAIQNSSFNSGELEREKLVVIEEIHRGQDNPGRVFSQELFHTAYKVHPYGRKVIGTDESVSSVSRGDMLRFFKNWYVPSNMKLVVVGGVTAENVYEKAEDFFSSEGGSAAETPEIREPEQTETRIFRLVRDSDPARISIAFPIGSLTDPETPVLDLMASVLSGGGSARLPIRLRDTGIVNSAWSYAYTPRDPGLFILGATTQQELVQDALEGLLEQISILQREPVSREELDRARDQILNEKIFSKEAVEGQAREIGYMALTLGDISFYDNYYSRLQAVDAVDILSAARRVFSPQAASVGFLTRSMDSQPSDEEVQKILSGKLAPKKTSKKASEGVIFKSALPNGITLLVREDHRLPLFAVRLGVLGGVRYENEDTQGAFNLLSHLLRRGTKNYTAAELAEKLDSMSASLGGFSGRNSFGVTGKFLSRDIEEGFSLLRELTTEAVVPERELDLMRTRVVSAIRAKKDNMVSYALDLFRGTLFSEHPYRFSTMGSEESVNSLTRNQLVDLYRAIVKPGGMVISVTGDIEVGDAYRFVEKYFGDIEGMSFDPGPMPVEFDKEGVTETRLTRDDKAQTHIVLGYPGPDLKSPDIDTLKVMNAVLTGMGGRLFTELRDRMSLAYSVFSFVAPGLDPGYFAFGIGVSPERESEAIKAFLEQIKMLREEAVSQEELARAKMYLIGSHTIRLQTVNSRADEVFFPVLYGQDLEKALLYSRRINSVTVEQIQEAARKYFDLENYTVAIIQGSAAAIE